MGFVLLPCSFNNSGRMGGGGEWMVCKPEWAARGRNVLRTGEGLKQTLISPSMFCSCSERKPQDEETWRINRNVEGLKTSVGGAYRLMESA